MASTHPNSIFRWEDAASLEHACWACPTKANSPRALQTCYGLHSMPCISYHPTMHALGAAHRCSGCITTKEMHDARHREIAELMAEYRAQESPSAVPETPTRRGPLLEIPPNIGVGVDQDLERRLVRYDRDRFEEGGIIAIHEDQNNDENVNTEATDANPHPDGVSEDEQEEDNDDDDDDTTSLSSYAPSSTDLPTTHTPSKKPTKAELRAQKKAKKSAKATSKALKNQTRNLVTITPTDIDKVARVLHGDEHDATSDGSAHPLATDKTVEDVISRSLGFVKSIQAHKAHLFACVAKGRREVKERKRLRRREAGGCGAEDMEMEGVVGAIMIRLGVSPGVVTASAAGAGGAVSTSTPLRLSTNGVSSGRKRTSAGVLTGTPGSAGVGSNGKSGGCAGASRASIAVAVKLRIAIRTDLEKHENEVHARYVRAGGFWRYVGKAVFERMTDFARETDVATGESWEKKWAREGKTAVISDNVGDEQDEDEGREE